MSEATSIATIFEDFGLDHAPDGWPPVKQMHLTAAAAELRRLEAQLQKETAARQAAQIEAEALKERLVRADAEKCAAVLAERIAPNAPVQEPVHKLIYPGGGKALFNRLWHLTCNAVATQSGMRVRTDVMPMREMKEFLDHLCVLVDSPPQPVPAPPADVPMIEQKAVEPVGFVNRAAVNSAIIDRARGVGDTHTWSEKKTSFHSVPFYTSPQLREESRNKGWAVAKSLQAQVNILLPVVWAAADDDDEYGIGPKARKALEALAAHKET